MILAHNKLTGNRKTFDTPQMYEYANMLSGGNLEIIPFDEPVRESNEVIIIQPKKFSSESLTYDFVSDNIEIFTKEQLNILAKDNRKPISNLAKKQLKN